MNWRLRAKIQNSVALLPLSLSYAVYYYIQRHFGTLRRVDPVEMLNAGIKVCKKIETLGRSPVGGVFFEVGTGRRISVPLAFWLIGAEKIITVDLNPYLKEELIREDINWIVENQEKTERLFEDRIYQGRFQTLLDLTKAEWRLSDLLKLCNINYVAPADATNLPIPPCSVDFHTSAYVFEHAPADTIKSILQEGNRIIRDRGLFVHRMDLCDHFSHYDKSISSINFLQFSDKEWSKIAENRYMYLNRLRIDDFCDSIYPASGHRILDVESQKNYSVLELLKDGNLTLNDRFAGKSREAIATVAAWIVSEKCN